MPEVRHPPASHDAPPAAAAPADTGEIHRPAGEAYARTWELELLISGAVLYALFQLPGALDRWYWDAAPHLVGSTRQLVGYIYYYAKLVCYTLGAAFVLHLAARAYWVGLLGLDTAFPRGVRWDRLKHSPITMQVYRERETSLEAIIHRVDRFCSIIFSFSFVIVFIFVYSVAAMLVMALVSFPISRLFFDGENVGDISRTLFFVLITPILLATLLDRVLRGRLDSSRGLGRVVYRTSRWSYTAMAGVSYVPVFNVLLSNLRRSAFYAVFTLVFAGVTALFLVKDNLIPAGVIAVSGYEFLPDAPEVAVVDYRHYADQRMRSREQGPVPREPTIQSQVVRDPFVRLFLPYHPRLHGALVRERCPGVRPLGGSGPRWVGSDPTRPDSAATRAVLECLAAIQPVWLNGAPLSPSYRFYTEPESGQRGIVAFLPVAGLPAGENRLTVSALQEVREEDGDEGETHPAHPPYEIPFWVERPAAAAPATP